MRGINAVDRERDGPQSDVMSMRLNKNTSGRKHEQGIVITLVAVFVLFVLGAMAALSIDVVTLYTARSEAQLAADAGALAGARVLANSGATSDTTGALMPSAWTLAQTVATQVAEQNQVGGVYLTGAEITFPPPAPGGTNTNPTITVRVQKTDLPTFFARIWGKTQVTVGASATAEAYNPSGAANYPRHDSSNTAGQSDAQTTEERARRETHSL